MPELTSGIGASPVTGNRQPSIGAVVTARGRFITFEGGEGAGKTTQLRRLADELGRRGIETVTTREPGGTELAETIRTLVLSDAASGLTAEGEAVLFAAARTDHVDRVIRPALEAGKWVLCDRFIDSSEAYQGAERGADLVLLRQLEFLAVAGTRPDLTIVFDLPVELGLARAAKRHAGTADRFERESVERHERRRRAFLAIAAREPERCVVIDASLDEDAVFAAILAAVVDRLGLE
ncbi:MAG: dTMP kinase [Bauldia sp.]|nr:dTMP kinase [Bauldia sp.]